MKIFRLFSHAKDLMTKEGKRKESTKEKGRTFQEGGGNGPIGSDTEVLRGKTIGDELGVGSRGLVRKRHEQSRIVNKL